MNLCLLILYFYYRNFCNISNKTLERMQWRNKDAKLYHCRGRVFIKIMIIFQIKEETEHEILPHKTRSLDARIRQKRPLTFQNSKLAFAFRRDRLTQVQQTDISNNKPSHLAKITKSLPDHQSQTIAVNSNINFQLMKIPPCNDSQKRAEFLKKKSLSILKTPERVYAYKSLTKFKRSHTNEGEVKLSRTEMLKSMLVQFDKNVSERTYLKKGNEQVNKEKGFSFLTGVVEPGLRPKSSTQPLKEVNERKGSEEYIKPGSRYKQETRISLNQQQIQIIVRKSLKQIQSERESLRKSTSKSLISFTQKSNYLRKMKRVQSDHEPY